MASEDREARRRRRLGEPMRAYALGQEPDDDLARTTTASERLAMMWPLARRCWRLMGRPFPSYRREDIPGVVIRPKG